MAIQIVMDHTGDIPATSSIQKTYKHWRRRKSDSESSLDLASLRLSGPLREGSPKFNRSIRTLKRLYSFRGWSAASHVGGSCSCFNDLWPLFARASMLYASYTGQCWLRSRRMPEACSL